MRKPRPAKASVQRRDGGHPGLRCGARGPATLAAEPECATCALVVERPEEVRRDVLAERVRREDLERQRRGEVRSRQAGGDELRDEIDGTSRTQSRGGRCRSTSAGVTTPCT